MQPVLPWIQDWRRPLWLALLIVSSVAFTLGLACAAPFAAFSAATALTLPKRDALILTLGLWLANQTTGFLLMGYPWDAGALAWGGALGVTALLCLGAARLATRRLRHLHIWSCCALAFLASFTAYEVTLYGFSLALGGTEIYTFAIQSRVFAVNSLALVILLALNYLGSALRITPARALHA